MIHDQAISIYRPHFFLAFLEVRPARRGAPRIQSTMLINFLFRQPHDQHADKERLERGAAESDAVLLIDHFVRHDTYGDLKFYPITVMLKFLSGLPPGM